MKRRYSLCGITPRHVFCLLIVLMAPSLVVMAADGPEARSVEVFHVWPSEPPSWNAPSEAEKDSTPPDGGRTVAGKRVVRLTNVSHPRLHLYRASTTTPSDTVVLISPGGGYSILAWDLEGTEIAMRLAASGIDAVVLKYRVPTRSEGDDKWVPAVQDIQRSVALIRAGKVTGRIPERVGALGFSAGGNATARAATATERHYAATDLVDERVARPDFAALIYPAWLVEEADRTQLIDGIHMDGDCPPMFLAHADNDRLTVHNSITLFSKLHDEGIPAALHVFTGSGHGFGGRDDGRADDHWIDLLVAWLGDMRADASLP
ncbi:MAG: alpha/beta hydrolase [Planctomycetota bacterium]